MENPIGNLITDTLADELERAGREQLALHVAMKHAAKAYPDVEAAWLAWEKAWDERPPSIGAKQARQDAHEALCKAQDCHPATRALRKAWLIASNRYSELRETQSSSPASRTRLLDDQSSR